MTREMLMCIELEKRIVALEASIAKLTAKIPPTKKSRYKPEEPKEEKKK